MAKRGSDAKKRFLLIHQSFAFLHSALKYGTWIALGWFGLRAIEALAGKSTVVNAVVNALWDSGNDFGMPWFLAFACGAWALGERHMRRRKTEEMQRHVRELEKRLDPQRTGSGLLASGVHDPKDQL